MPWMDANGISIHFELAGHGPSVVLLHEMGGTLDSWDGIVPALSERFRTLRYDQRGSGVSEKVRQPITTEILVEDLEAVLQGSGLAAPYHFVTVAAATMQALIYMTRHPDRIASFVFCNPFTGADPSRVAALEERAGLAEREGLRKAIPVTLDKSWPADIGERAAYAAYRGRYLAHDPVCFAAMNRSIVRPNVTHLAKDIRRTLARWFSPEVIKANPPHLDKVRQMIRTTPVNGFIGCAAALADHNYAAAVATVTRPVLFMVGEKDAAAAPMRKLNEALPGSRYVELAGAGHISNLDQPTAFTRAIKDFLAAK